MTADTPPVIKTAKTGHSLLSPMTLSALVYPGAGQLMQRRWGAGIFFIVASTVVGLWLFVTVFVVLKAYYGLAFAPMNAPVEVPGLAALVIPFSIWLVIYVAGIVDTAIGSYRLQMKTTRPL